MTMFDKNGKRVVPKADGKKSEKKDKKKEK